MPVEGILLMILGFVGVVFLVGVNISKTQQENQRKKNEQIETKIDLQPLILAAKSIYPNSELILYDHSVVLKVPLYNSNNKKVGKIEIYGNKTNAYRNDVYYMVNLEIAIFEKSYEARKNFLPENIDVLKETILELEKELMSNEDLKKRILATTY